MNILVGTFNLSPTEMCFVQYLPIKMRALKSIRIPRNIGWIEPLVDRVCKGAGDLFDYIYVTVKYTYVSEGCSSNRPGWHIDGYGSDDVNYIWYDKFPTEIMKGTIPNLSEDHEESLKQMEEYEPKEIITFPENSLLRLDNTIIHRVAPIKESGMRAFVKITLSKHKYNLKGNAHNYLFDYDWKMYDRKESRNHPFVEEGDE